MNLKKLIFTNNACYKIGKIMTIKGIMVHSTGANNPNLKRYVGPDDGLLGKNTSNNHWNQDKPDGRQVCVHAFIGKLANGSVATYQNLPWNMCGWHGGGASNNTYIGFEICEDGLTDKAYFDAVYKEAVELCAYLCKTYNIKPESPSLICHSEGYKLGIASNHGDVMHWFPKFGKSMDTFRTDVKVLMNTTISLPSTPTVNATSNEKAIWDFLTGKGLNMYAVAGIMGNLFAESGLKSTNLQSTYEKSLCFTDDSYTEAVDKCTYVNFVKDSAGYGLAQWTYYTRKQALLDFARASGVSIGNLTMQLNFLWKELQGYPSVMTVLKSAKSVIEASNAVLLQFERPADQSVAVQTKRAEYGQGYYNKYADKTTVTPQAMPYTIKVTASELMIRKGAGTNFATNGAIKDKGSYTIVEEAAGAGAKKWGSLKSGAGWIALDFTTKV